MSLINKLVRKAHIFTGSLDAKLNFDPTQNLTYTIDGKKTNIDNITINPDSFRIYIGAMDRKHQGTYTDELIIGMIYYLIQVAKVSHTTIVLGTPVSKAFNDDPDKMNTEEQKKHLTGLIKKNFGKSTVKKIHIHGINEHEHKETFHLIKEGYRQSLYEPKIEKINSTEVWKYLYRLYSNNKEFANDIKKTKPQELQNSTQADLYGITEIAIRFTDFLQGITLQGGIKRQEKYDKIITNILNPYYPNYGKCKELRSIMNKTEPTHFRTLYFDTNKTHNIVEKTEKAKQTTNKMRNIIMAITGSLLMAFGGAIGGLKRQENKQYKKMQEITEQNIDEILGPAKIIESGRTSTELKTIAEKKEFLQRQKTSIYESYIEIYNNSEELNEKQAKIVQNIIIDEILRDQNYKGLASQMSGEFYRQKFLIENIIANNKNTLIQAGLSTTFYPNLTNKKQAIYNTLQLQDNEHIKIPTTNSKGRERERDEPNYKEFKRMYEDMIYNRKLQTGIIYARGNTTQDIQYLGQYRIHNADRNSSSNRGSLVEYTDHTGKEYIAGLGVYSHDYMSTEDIKPFLYRYLYHSMPDIRQIADTYQKIFFKYETQRSSIKNDYSREKKHFMERILPLLIRDLIENTNIFRSNTKAKPYPKFTKEIIEYIQSDFLPRHSQEIESLEYVKLGSKPYPHMQENRQAMQQTIDNGMNDLPAWLSASQRDKKEEEHTIESITVIGPYITQDNISYDIALVTIDGKSYIYAENKEQGHYNSGLSLYYGIQVAQDFLNNYCQE